MYESRVPAANSARAQTDRREFESRFHEAPSPREALHPVQAAGRFLARHMGVLGHLRVWLGVAFIVLIALLVGLYTFYGYVYFMMFSYINLLQSRMKKKHSTVNRFYVIFFQMCIELLNRRGGADIFFISFYHPL